MLTNTKESYGWVAIALHWIAAAGVILMFYHGFQASIADEAADRVARRLWMGLHISTGASLFVFFAARIVWAYVQPRPVKPPQARWLNILSSAVQHTLLLALALQIISGPLAVWSGGRPINVFDIVSLPSPFAAPNEGIHEAAELMHLVGRIVLFFLIPLHVLGALKHVVIDRDGTFRRMLYPSKLKT